MKKLLFVINTLSRAGAEAALMELLRRIDPREYDVSLFVLTGQGELVHELPEYVKVRNSRYSDVSVLTDEGRKELVKTTVRSMLSRGTVLKRAPYLVSQSLKMLKQGKIQKDKLLWRVIADGAERLEEEFDLAVAYLEGGSAYYVADHVRAKRKAAFVHIDYPQAGYHRGLDLSCYLKFDRIFTVSKEIQEPFFSVYPELRDRVQVFHNLLNIDLIKEKSQRTGGFPKDYDGIKLLTVGRLNTQKAFEYSIDTMKLLKDRGIKARWYVLGEGDQRPILEKRIQQLGLEKDFILYGSVDNPYPWYAQCDLYVHCSRFEGKSIAIQEAQILGCAMVVSDCSGNREQVTQGVDGTLCELDAQEMCRSIEDLLTDEVKRARFRKASADKYRTQENQMDRLFELIE